MVDSATGGHNLASSTLHVAPLINDPLSDSWEGLPPVEIAADGKDMRAYFHPEATGRLRLPVANRMPVRIELLVMLPNWGRYLEGVCLNTLIPQLKALSEIELRNGMINITLLHVGLRQAIPVTRHGSILDWDALGPALDGIYGDVVDVHNIRRIPSIPPIDFLTQQVRRRLADNGDSTRPGEQRLVLIVVGVHYLFFKDPQWRPPILDKTSLEQTYLIQDYPKVDSESKPTRTNVDNAGGIGQVYLPGPAEGQGPMVEGLPQQAQPIGSGLGPMGINRPPWDRGYGPRMASLQEILKFLNPRNFNVKDPVHFRKALATILEDISRM
jgi:hypothetical protein